MVALGEIVQKHMVDPKMVEAYKKNLCIIILWFQTTSSAHTVMTMGGRLV